MAKLIYRALVSLDGYIEDESGNFEWAMPDSEVHGFINDLERDIGTFLYGRSMYETMRPWQTVGVEPQARDESPVTSEQISYAQVWQAAHKVVYSRTLDSVSTPRTRLEKEFDPEVVEVMKQEARQNLTVAGAGLAQKAFAARLIDEIQLFVFPAIVGGGKPGLPKGLRVNLELVEEQQFERGVIYLAYRIDPRAS